MRTGEEHTQLLDEGTKARPPPHWREHGRGAASLCVQHQALYCGLHRAHGCAKASCNALGPHGSLSIVAHSNGGLVGRWALGERPRARAGLTSSAAGLPGARPPGAASMAAEVEADGEGDAGQQEAEVDQPENAAQSSDSAPGTLPKTKKRRQGGASLFFSRTSSGPSHLLGWQIAA